MNYKDTMLTCDMIEAVRKLIQKLDADVGSVITFDYSVAKKYIKIFWRSDEKTKCAWGFIVNTTSDIKFEHGDILKADGFHGPARNFARGNVLAGNYKANWLGL